MRSDIVEPYICEVVIVPQNDRSSENHTPAWADSVVDPRAVQAREQADRTRGLTLQALEDMEASCMAARL